MLRDIIDARNLTEEFCAKLVGASTDHFKEWASGERPIPRFLIPELVSIFGVSREELRGDRVAVATENTGGVWFKLRREGKCNTSDLEMIGLTRKLCFRVGQFSALMGQNPEAYRDAFASALTAADSAESPEEQGRFAAQIVREEFGWTHGNTGIGEIIRQNLRQKGLVVVESPFRDALVEGCSFLTEGPVSQMACLFVNIFGITWFRRNAVLLHELCHAIFDLGADSFSVDYQGYSGEGSKELRAQAFAQECLVPRGVLIHYQNQFGIHWQSLTPKDLAQLIASCHASQNLILKAALDCKFIDSADFVRYSGFECSALLANLTTHLLSTKDYANTLSSKQRKWIYAKRFVEFGDGRLLLPAKYLQGVIQALNERRITVAKAAELTMMDRYEFQARFAPFIES